MFSGVREMVHRGKNGFNLGNQSLANTMGETQFDNF